MSIQQESYQQTIKNKMLGVVGEHKDFVLEQDYNSIALPKYNKPIKLSLSLVEFNSSSYKAFEASKVFQNEPIQISYQDSLKQKPKFIKLEIEDRLAILNALKENHNQDVFQLLQNKNEAHIVTALSLVFQNNTLVSIMKADEVFLETSGIKNYVIKAYKNDELLNSIQFNEAVVFAYQTSNVCWKQNNKYQLEIVDLVESNDKCSKGSYKSSKLAEKKMDYYKF